MRFTRIAGWWVIMMCGSATACRSSSTASGSIESWARWPMPNAPLPGLPHPHDYDLGTPDVVVDRITGLMWQRRSSDSLMTWTKAQQACADLTLASHTDWRLPSRIELVSLLDTRRTQPSIDVEVFPGTPSDWFWTSSRAADDANAAWYVYFYFGYPRTDDVSNSFSVRCVRTAQPPAVFASRYQVQAQDVRDVATNLLWQRVPTTEALTFEAARSYCSGLKLDGHEQWRVPTLGELLTLIDERASTPMVDQTAFPGTPADAFWTSSTFANGNELAWYVRFDRGSGLYGRLSESFHVRCVL